jgi:hypothetical protein
MDDSTTIKKKKFGGIRKLGKFFGLGGSATKSETKSQIDDYEEFDLSTATNGIESIMALTPEQKALPVILLTEPEPQPPSPASINSSGFKPKSIPTSLNRAPGRTPLSSRSQDSKILEPVPTPDPSPPPPSAAPVSVPTQRVEDIIRLKIPLHRRNSKLTTSESEERIESQLPSSPVAVNGRSPMPRAAQVRHPFSIYSELLTLLRHRKLSSKLFLTLKIQMGESLTNHCLQPHGSHKNPNSIAMNL